ncbi:hypothetical protein [Noviherbaspirillum saxi]|uniref:hypothetical protein n=1 Tax=Noviherbaspirillum saxi TaxID=2320863 RepID=UPI0011C36432|nr:hypothetical protein [Noviherbaspirillum saxi]
MSTLKGNAMSPLTGTNGPLLGSNIENPGDRNENNKNADTIIHASTSGIQPTEEKAFSQARRSSTVSTLSARFSGARRPSILSMLNDRFSRRASINRDMGNAIEVPIRDIQRNEREGSVQESLSSTTSIPNVRQSRRESISAGTATVFKDRFPDAMSRLAASLKKLTDLNGNSAVQEEAETSLETGTS